jgi:hypothetical protein
LQLVVWQKRRQELRTHHQQMLCLKQYITTTSRLVKRVNALNGMITSGQITQVLLLLFPGLGAMTAGKVQHLKQHLKRLQELAYFDAQKDYLKSLSVGCRLPLTILRTPYLHQSQFVRTNEITKLRAKNFDFIHRTPLITSRVSWQLDSGYQVKLDWRLE